jgi:hypothetical protein
MAEKTLEIGWLYNMITGVSVKKGMTRREK